jgi:hypothetical protein
MEHKNQVPNLTPSAKAKRRRERIASVFLFVVLVGCIVLTVVRWRHFR